MSGLGGRDSLLLFFPIWKANCPNLLLNTPILPPRIANVNWYLYFLFWIEITQIFILTCFANQEDETLKGSNGSLQMSVLLSSHRVPSCSAFLAASPAHSAAQPRFIALLQYLGLENPHSLPSTSPRENTCAVKPRLSNFYKSVKIDLPDVSWGHSQGHISHRTALLILNDAYICID